MARVTLANCKARVLDTAMWPSTRCRKTGWFWLTSSISHRLGNSFTGQSVLPTAAHNPFAGLCGFHASANTIAKFGQRLRSNQIYGEELETGVGQAQMRIVESRHHEMVVHI